MHRLLASSLLCLLTACASAPQPPEVVGDYMFGVDAYATDAAGKPMPEVRVSIQFLGPPAYDVLTPVSEQTGYTNSEGLVRFSFISSEPAYSFNLIFFREGYKTVWLEGLKCRAPETPEYTAVMKRPAN